MTFDIAMSYLCELEYRTLAALKATWFWVIQLEYDLQQRALTVIITQKLHGVASACYTPRSTILILVFTDCMYDSQTCLRAWWWIIYLYAFYRCVFFIRIINTVFSKKNCLYIHCLQLVKKDSVALLHVPQHCSIGMSGMMSNHRGSINYLIWDYGGIYGH